VLELTQPQDLLDYGLIPELVGRLPVISTLHELSEEALKQILLEPKNALIKQFKRLFELDNIELEFEDSALDAIVSKAQDRKTGARALRAILEEAMLEPMFEVPSRDDITKCIITEDVITKKAKPRIIYKERKSA